MEQVQSRSAGGQTRYAADDLARAEQAFGTDYPAFGTTRRLDELRAAEYGRLDERHQLYLDYTGGGLYAAAQLREHMALLAESVLGNPHSLNPTSLAMTQLIDEARAHVLAYFRASPAEYAVVFTPNASGALKLVGEAYPFTPASRLTLSADNHNSVNGIREFARSRGARTTYVPVIAPELRLDAAAMQRALDAPTPDGAKLLAYPAQSNFSGAQHALEWIAYAQARGWDVLLDAAAFVPTNRLDLSVVHPDFVALSFYKIFGYPTGVGALLVRNSALRKLRRPWFAGGTISIASVMADQYRFVRGGAAFEDGTVNYLSLPGVTIGLRFIEGIGIETIHTRVVCLTSWLLEQLLALRHTNGQRMLRVLGPTTVERRGGTLALKFFDPDGCVISDRRIEELANRSSISLRTGCFCNPGAGEIAHGLTPADMDAAFAAEGTMTYVELIGLMEARGKGVSAVRISTGLATTFADVYCFMAFVAQLRDQSVAELGAPAAAAGHAQPDTA